MNENTRITMTDTGITVIPKLSDGRPGAINVMCAMLKEGQQIDPDGMGGIGALLMLDSHGIYGSDIWLLYRDICKQNLVDMIGVLRAVQLGFCPESALLGAIRACDGPFSADTVPLDVEGLVAQVRQRLPQFGQEAEKEKVND